MIYYWPVLLRGSAFITVTGIHARQNTLPSYAYGLGLLVNLLLLRLLVPPFGMMGAALAVVITYASVSLGLLAIAQRIYPIPYRMSRIGGLLGLLTVLFLLGNFLAPSAVLLRLAFKSAVLAAFPALLLVFRFFTPEEITKARALVAPWIPWSRTT